jgi:hypothetical protein
MYKFIIKDSEKYNEANSPFALYVSLLTEGLPGYPIMIRIGKIMDGTQRKETQLLDEIEALKFLMLEGKIVFDPESFHIFRNILYFHACNTQIPPTLTSRYLCIQCQYNITNAKDIKTKKNMKEVELRW